QAPAAPGPMPRRGRDASALLASCLNGERARRCRRAGAAGARLGSRVAARSARPQALEVADSRSLLDGSGHASLLESHHLEVHRLALGHGERVAVLDLEAVAAKVRKDAITVAAELDE